MNNLKSFTELANLQDIQEFLRSKPLTRRHFCHYSTVDGLVGMIRSSKLHLSKGTKMNDLLECDTFDTEKWERTYIASFTHTYLESIAMWCVYSRQLSESLRLQFFPSKIWKLIDNANKTEIYQVKANSQYSLLGYPEDIFLCDVSYLREHSLSLDGDAIHERNCSEINTILSEKSMVGLVKHSSWEYEKETRLCIVLPRNKKCKYPDKIAINFDGITNVTIMGSPCFNHDKLEKTISELKKEFKDDETKSKTINSIRYSRNNIKHCCSALTNRLYLPAFCENCVIKRDCKLYKNINE